MSMWKITDSLETVPRTEHGEGPLLKRAHTHTHTYTHAHVHTHTHIRRWCIVDLHPTIFTNSVRECVLLLENVGGGRGYGGHVG